MITLPYKLTLHVPLTRYEHVEHLLPDAYHDHYAWGHWKGDDEQVVIVSVAGDAEELHDLRDLLAVALLELGEEAVYYELTRNDGGLLRAVDFSGAVRAA